MNVVSKKQYRGINPLLLQNRLDAAWIPKQVLGDLQTMARVGGTAIALHSQ